MSQLQNGLTAEWLYCNMSWLQYVSTAIWRLQFDLLQFDDGRMTPCRKMHPKPYFEVGKFYPKKSQYPIFPNGKILSFFVTVNLLSSSSSSFLFTFSFLSNLTSLWGATEKGEEEKEEEKPPPRLGNIEGNPPTQAHFPEKSKNKTFLFGESEPGHGSDVSFTIPPSRVHIFLSPLLLLPTSPSPFGGIKEEFKRERESRRRKRAKTPVFQGSKKEFR